MSKYELTAMANLGKQTTGLPLAIRIDQAPSNKKEPRIKAALDISQLGKDGGQSVSISIAREPQVLKDFAKVPQRDLQATIAWVRHNRSMLLKYWYHIEDDTHVVLTHLKNGSDNGESFDTIMETIIGMWGVGSTVEEIRKRLEDRVPSISIEKIERIMKSNRRFFPPHFVSKSSKKK
jgi:hypothetical protein